MHAAVIAGDAIARCVVNLPPILAQQGGGNVFVQPEDMVLMWAERAALVVALFSVMLLLFVLLKRRQRLMEGQSKWLLFLGLCVFPVPIVLLSAGIGMEESKKVEFCHSCHASMDPFVDDMMDPDSDYLAAIHSRTGSSNVNTAGPVIPTMGYRVPPRPSCRACATSPRQC